MFEQSLQMTHANAQKVKTCQNNSQTTEKSRPSESFCCFWPPLLCTQSMTACTPSERVSSSLRCHTAQQDPAGHVGPKGMSARKPKKGRETLVSLSQRRHNVNVSHRTPPSTPFACAPHPANGVRMSNKSCSLSIGRTLLYSAGSLVAHPWVGRNATYLEEPVSLSHSTLFQGKACVCIYK